MWFKGSDGMPLTGIKKEQIPFIELIPPPPMPEYTLTLIDIIEFKTLISMPANKSAFPCLANEYGHILTNEPF